MKKIFAALFILAILSISFSGGGPKREKFGVYAWMDTAYFMNVPYNSGAGIVHVGIDTVASSPTFGKFVRKTATSSSFTNLTQFVSQNNWKTFYSDGSGDVQELSIGANGKVLTSNGTAAAPSWQDVSATSWNGHFNGTSETVGTPVTLGSFPVNINTDAGAVTYTLPLLATFTGNMFLVKNAGGANLTVQRTSSDNIYTTTSVTSEVVAPGESRLYVAASSFWYSFKFQ